VDVMINGQPYRPTLPVGVAISTHNRQWVLDEALGHYLKHTPEWMPIIVVDDASTVPAVVPSRVTLVRQNINLGIAATKNRCISELMDLGVQHLFLSDDDVWPTTDEWWLPYMESPEPHLMMLFKDRTNKKMPPTIYDDGSLYSFTHPRGCFLYAQRTVIDRVGGMRLDFGRWGGEHAEWSRRIYAAGLTSFPFADMRGNGLYSMDESCTDPKFERSVSQKERDASVQREDELRDLYDGTTDYVEYRTLPNLAVTTFLTKHGSDPQRKSSVPKIGEYQQWRESFKGCQHVILADTPVEGTELVPVGLKNPYFQRWFNIYQYLRDNPAKWVWVTDGTDVVMLREPWDHMQPGKLYMGYEPTVVGCPWMLNSHPTHKEWVQANSQRTLLNAGVVGGDHATVLELCQKLLAEISLMTLDPRPSVGEMAAINKVAYEYFGDRIVTGPSVVTAFKAEETNVWSWFKHK